MSVTVHNFFTPAYQGRHRGPAAPARSGGQRRYPSGVTSARRWLPAVLAAVMAAEAAVVVAASARHGPHWSLQVGLAVDCALLAALGLWLGGQGMTRKRLVKLAAAGAVL